MTPHLDTDRIIVDWNRLRDSDPEALAAELGYATAAAMYLAVGMPRKALQVAELEGKATDLEPLSTLWIRARCLYETKQWNGLKLLASRAPRIEGEAPYLGLAERLAIRLAWVHLRQGDAAEAKRIAAAVMSVPLRKHGSLDVIADASHLEAFLSFRHSGDVSLALRAIDTAVALRRQTGESMYLGQALLLKSVMLRAAGLLSSSLRSASEATQVCAAEGHLPILRDSLGQIAVCQYRLGQLEAAMESVAQAIRMGHELCEAEDPKIECTLELIRGRTLLRLGRIAEAVECLATVSEIAGSADKKHEAMLTELDGLVRLEQGDLWGALNGFDQCIAFLQEQSVRSYELAEAYLRRAEAHLALEDYPKAYDDTTTALSLLDKAGEGLERGHILRVKALAAYQMGRPKESRKLFVHSERELRRVGDLYELGRCLVDKADLSPREEAESALADAAEAVNLFERIGVEKLAERARDIFAVCHLRLQRAQHARAVLQQNTNKIIASSEAMQNVLADCERAARRNVTVLITGETGVGKEVVARFAHDASDQAKNSFVAVNCAAIPDNLFEREFFGHAKGAYTGADSDKPGLVEAADGGTLFLDEIGEMPLPLQPKLLRLFQEGTYRRVGDVTERRVQIRFLAATNRDLQDLVKEKRFREDLYYRLGWFRVEIPPLRERIEDMVDLTKLFLDRESLRSKTIFWLQKEAWTLLKRYHWPGNVRELEAAICSAVARAEADGCIRTEHLPAELRDKMPNHHNPTLELQKHLDSQERELILRALRRADYQRARAARLLGIGRNTLYEKMKKFGIKPER